MFRKFLFPIFSFALFFVATPVFAAFPDVPVSDPYYLDIARLQKLEFVKGDERGLFNPNKGITRCEMGNLTWQVYKTFQDEGAVLIDDGFPVSVFPDIPNDHWCNFEASRLKYFGIVKGNEKGFFEPDREVSAAEAFKMILNAANVDFGSYESDPDADWKVNFAGYVFSHKLEDYNSFQSIPLDQPISRNSVARIMKRIMEFQENSIYEIYDFDSFAPIKMAYPKGMYEMDKGPILKHEDDEGFLLEAEEPVVYGNSVWGNNFMFRYADEETLNRYMKIGGYSYWLYSLSNGDDDKECAILGKKEIHGTEFTKYKCPGYENAYGYYALIGGKYFWAETSYPVRNQSDPFWENFEDVMSSVRTKN